MQLDIARLEFNHSGGRTNSLLPGVTAFLLTKTTQFNVLLVDDHADYAGMG
jgi:hypothetical protein